MSGYERENRNVLRRCLKTASARSCECATADCGSTNACSDQSRTNAVVVVTTCLRREWSRTGNNSVQRHEWLDMLELPIRRRCVQGYAANEGWWAQERCARNAVNRILRLLHC